MQRETEIREVIEARLGHWASLIAHGRDILLWERPVISLTIVLVFVPLFRIFEKAISSLPLASAICVGLAACILGFYISRANPGGVQRIIATILGLFPNPISTFEETVKELSRIMVTLEQLWNKYVLYWSRNSPEPIPRAIAAIICIIMAFLLSYVTTPLMIGVITGGILTIPGAIHHKLPQLILSRIKQAQNNSPSSPPPPQQQQQQQVNQ